MAYTAAGLTRDASSSYFLPRSIGVRRAREMMLTNRVLSAEEALDWGLINKVVADDTVLAEAQKLASRLAKGPTKAYGAVKAMLDASIHNQLEDQLQLEADNIAKHAGSKDGQEGMHAVMEKRKPEFTGD